MLPEHIAALADSGTVFGAAALGISIYLVSKSRPYVSHVNFIELEAPIENPEV